MKIIKSISNKEKRIRLFIDFMTYSDNIVYTWYIKVNINNKIFNLNLQ